MPLPADSRHYTIVRLLPPASPCFPLLPPASPASPSVFIMTDPNTRSAPAPLQFDRAIESGSPAADAQATALLTCSSCGQPIKTYYYYFDGETVCAACKQTAEQAGAAQSSGDAFL